MFGKTHSPRIIALVVTLFALLLTACGDNTATTAPVAVATTAPVAVVTTAPAAATTAPAMAATTAPATTAPAMVATTAPATTAPAMVATTAPTAATTAPVAPVTVVYGTPVGQASGNAKISLSTLHLGIIPAENASKVLDSTKPFADAMSKQLGVPVVLSVGTNYTAVIEALSSGKIDVAWFGPFSYVLATDKYGAKIIARQLTTDGADHYNSMIITTAKTGIKTLADLKGHSFSFVDPASTSGHLIPVFTLMNNGLNPDTDIKATYAGGHDASLLGVISGKTDAGAVASDVMATLIASGKVKQSDFIVLNKSMDIPESPIAVRKDLSDSDAAAIKAAFLSIKDKDALTAAGAGGFIDSKDSDYGFLRDIAKAEGLDLSKLK